MVPDPVYRGINQIAEDLEVIQQVGQECADLFKRSSSCDEESVWKKCLPIHSHLLETPLLLSHSIEVDIIIRPCKTGKFCTPS